MRIPLPKNTLVALTLVGGILVAALSITLAVPGAVPGMAGDDTGNSDTLSSDAPTPNENFTPMVDNRGGGEYEDDEHEEEEHDDDDDDHEEEEHEDDDHEDDDDDHDSMGSVEVAVWR